MIAAETQYEAGNYDQVIELCDIALQKDRGQCASAAVNLRGRAHEGKGELKQAMADYTDAVTENPKNWGALCDRGWLYAVRKEYMKALKDLNQAIALAPNGSPKDKQVAQGLSYYVRAKVYESKGDYENAVSDYKKAIELGSTKWRVYSSLAWILATAPNHKLRNGADALNYATTACALSEWKDSEAIDTFAAASAEVGDFAAAIKWEQIAVATGAVSETKKGGYAARLVLYQMNKPYRAEGLVVLKPRKLGFSE